MTRASDRRHLAPCGPDCRYRHLYEGAQLSLTDISARQADALGRLGRVRAGVVRAIRVLNPTMFADAERRLGKRMIDADDEIMLAYLHAAAGAGTGEATAQLRAALSGLGYRLPDGDDLDEWARELVIQRPPASGSGVPDAPRRTLRRPAKAADSDRAAGAQVNELADLFAGQDGEADEPSNSDAGSGDLASVFAFLINEQTPTAPDADSLKAAPDGRRQPEMSGDGSMHDSTQDADSDLSGVFDDPSGVFDEPVLDDPADAFEPAFGDTFPDSLGDEPEPELEPGDEPDRGLDEHEPAPGTEPAGAYRNGDVDTPVTGNTEPSQDTGSVQEQDATQRQTEPEPPVAAAPARRRSAGPPVRPQQTLPGVTAPGKRRTGGKTPRVSVTPAGGYDAPGGEPAGTVEVTLAERLQAAVAVPRPVFIDDLRGIAGDDATLAAWEQATMADTTAPIRFLPAKGRYRHLGSLVIPRDALAEAAGEFTRTIWGEGIARYRGAKLYELGVLLRRHSEAVVSWQLQDHTALIRLSDGRGVTGVVAVLAGRSDDPAIEQQVIHDVETLLKERLTVVVAVGPNPEVVEHLRQLLTATGQERQWVPTMPVAVGRGAEWADSRGTAVDLVLGG